LNITGLTLRVRLNYVQLKPILNNLINQEAIQELHLRNGSNVYAATSLRIALPTQFKQAEDSKTALADPAEPKMASMQMLSR
jgi:hypothetical protein